MDPVEQFLRETLADADAHGRRLAAINSRLGVSTERDERGYYKDERVHDGWNHVRAYLMEVARERGITL